jgi:hypothetical protein
LKFKLNFRLGNSEKTLHPRNVGFAEPHELSFQVMCENNSSVWLPRVNLLSISGWSKHAKLWNHKPAKIWNHEPAKFWNHEPARLWNHEPAKLCNREPVKIWNRESVNLRNRGSAKFGNLVKSRFGSYDVWRSSHVRDSETNNKPSQRRCLKSLG